MKGVTELIELRSRTQLEKRIIKFNEDTKKIVELRNAFLPILEKDVFDSYIKGYERVVLAEHKKFFKTPKSVLKDIVGVLGYEKSKNVLNQYLVELGYNSIFEVDTNSFGNSREIFIKFI